MKYLAGSQYALLSLGMLLSCSTFAAEPPIIPHRIDGFQVRVHANQCLTCHRRDESPLGNIPLIPGSHYLDRDLQATERLAGRRFFCLQCHVVQHDSPPPVFTFDLESRLP